MLVILKNGEKIKITEEEASQIKNTINVVGMKNDEGEEIIETDWFILGEDHNGISRGGLRISEVAAIKQ